MERSQKMSNMDNLRVDDYGFKSNDVRILPTGGGSNIICSYRTYLKEIRFRKKRNKNLEPFCKFDIPSWESLEKYNT